MAIRLRRWCSAVTLVVTAAFAIGACSGDDDGGDRAATSAPSSSSTTAAAATLQILVTNDDGIAAPGIDVLVEALRALPNTEVTVVAPAENKSGTGDQTTANPTAEDATTASGVAGTAVDGYPADSVVYALDALGLEPDLLVSGANTGQNIGPIAEVSGTVGAALTAARRGIPALAVSQGIAVGDRPPPPDFDIAVQAALDWIAEHRAAILAGDEPAQVTNINAPTCITGDIRGTVEVPVATELDEGATNPDCTSDATEPVDDVDAFATGYISLSVIEP
jgi:5'-nucleotidase